MDKENGVHAKVCKYVDQLGRVKAEIADLEAKEAELRQCLIDSGQELVEGKLYRATVSNSKFPAIDYKEVVSSLPKSSHLTKLVRRTYP